MLPNCWPPPASPSSLGSEFEPAIAGMKTLASTTITPRKTPYDVQITEIYDEIERLRSPSRNLISRLSFCKLESFS